MDTSSGPVRRCDDTSPGEDCGDNRGCVEVPRYAASYIQPKTLGQLIAPGSPGSLRRLSCNPGMATVREEAEPTSVSRITTAPTSSWVKPELSDTETVTDVLCITTEKVRAEKDQGPYLTLCVHEDISKGARPKTMPVNTKQRHPKTADTTTESDDLWQYN